MRLDDLTDDASHCPICGELLPTDKYYGRRKFCSRRCQREDYSRIERAARMEEKQARNRICRRCNGPISPHRDGRALYCSKACQVKASQSKAAKRYPLDCRICGKVFFGHHKGQIYCSPSCRAKAGVLVRRQRKQSAFPYI